MEKKTEDEIIIKRLFCLRCSYNWFPRPNKEGKVEEPNVCPKCLPPDAFISGEYKEIKDFKKLDSVFCENGKKGIVEGIFNHKYNGDMIEIKAQGCLPIKTTANHKILAVHCIQKTRSNKRKFSREYLNPEYVLACRLNARPTSRNINSCGDYLVIPRIKGNISDTKIDLTKYSSEHGNKVVNGKNIKNYFELNDQSAWLLGLYVAEGFTSKGKGEIQFCLGKHEKDLINETKNRLELLGYKPNIKERKTAITIIIYSRLLERALPDWCGHRAKNKRIPSFVLEHQNDKIIKEFLKGYISGDGHISRYEYRVCVSACTVSKTLALQIQLLGIRLGGFFRITSCDFSKWASKQKDGRVIKSGLQYRVRTNSQSILDVFNLVGANKHNKSYVMFDEFVAVPINIIKKSAYDGYVMNLQTTEGNYCYNNIVVKNCKSPYWDKERKNKRVI